jgi:hypothetical protein
MKTLLKKTLVAGAAIMLAINVSAQDMNPIHTAMPSLLITPDARAGGMGDAGVATAPDVYSQHWNPAKYAFAVSKGGFALSYTPWLRQIIDDVALMEAIGYYKLGSESNQALSASIRYFKIGDVQMTDWNNMDMGIVSPYEMAIDIAYSRKLTSTFSGSVAIRYMVADYAATNEGSAGSTFAADIAGYNESYINLGQSESLLSFGFNISNIGGKISNDGGNTKYFIPTNMRLGASLMYPMNDVSTLSFSADLNKLLVPTPPTPEDSGDNYIADMQKYNDTNSFSGIFKSFGDAPGGFSEEMKEINWSLGAEYDYNDQFKLRTGYFHENAMKGNRQYFTFGAGFKLSAFQLDVAYLLSTKSQNPLDKTLRFSLAFDMDGIQKLFNK